MGAGLTCILQPTLAHGAPELTGAHQVLPLLELGMSGELLAARKPILRKEGHPDLLRIEIVQDEGRVARRDDLQFWITFLDGTKRLNELRLSCRMQREFNIIEEDKPRASGTFKDS